eukprot:gnl/MRDRNA2_/MRDRNA2_85741_c1_seq5.p1 gnl/MRDRNA2_/MRDRNA2_85741_c1~~gnl/MRDRNA2_/MRDRNA2_85741_c1_seq5.p1  ORF type:complete len:400 (+),score=43.73 gnl/MRDRNA2_/MRDRNA2_85741_c1_seq5:82-1281(+)
MIMKVVLLLQLFCHAPSLRRIPIKEDSSQRNDLPVRANSKPDFSGRFFNTTAIIWPDELKNVEATFHNEDTFGIELGVATTPKVVKDPSLVELLRKTGKKKVWLVLTGDSNGILGYSYFVDRYLSHGKIVKSKTWGPQGVWYQKMPLRERFCDQEAIAHFGDLEVRASYRFIHGTGPELVYKLSHYHPAFYFGSKFDENGTIKRWNVAAADATNRDIDQTPIKITNFEGKLAGNESDLQERITTEGMRYQEWAAITNSFINFSDGQKNLAALLQQYESLEPDLLILAEGWGSVPKCEHFEDIQSLLSAKPETKYLWTAVIYNDVYRHMCFKQKMGKMNCGLGGVDCGRNIRVMDAYEQANKTLPSYRWQNNKMLHSNRQWLDGYIPSLLPWIEDLVLTT